MFLRVWRDVMVRIGKKNKQQQKQMREFFAALRMTKGWGGV
jgi:hypothetical protein